jgi:alpha-tubulin suppressor-like RCC1 family protein
MMGIKWSKSLKVLVAGCLLLVPSMLVIQSESLPVEAASANGPFVTRSVSIGVSHTCAVMTDKTVKCWGTNDRGQLGDETVANSDFPVDVIGITGAQSVAVGFSHSCALLENGTVKCWGLAMYTGTGDTTLITAIPEVVSNLSGVIQISSGIWQTCALTASGEVFCWGVRPDVDGPTPSSFLVASTPYQVTGLSQAEEVSVGMSSACALVSGGTIKCWGTQTNGALGNGATDSTRIAEPVTVTGITNAIGISLGSSSGACAVLSTGTVKCWGPLVNQQLGISTSPATVPVLVPGVVTAQKVALNSSVGCAILTSGSIRCWGATSGGLIGAGPFNGTTWLPATTVDGVTSASDLSIGSTSACVRLTNGLVKCWGSNGSGQLAQGYRTWRNRGIFYSPVFIKGPNVITLGLPTNKSLGDDPFSMASIASTTSGLPVTFTASGVACLAKEDLIIVKQVGSCRITADQVGSDHVAAALPVSTTFVVNDWSGVRTNAVVTFRFRTTEGLPVTGLRVTWRSLGAEYPASGTANITAANGSLTMSVISGPTLISVTSLYQPDDNSSFRKNSVDFFLNNYTTTRLLTQGEVVIDVGQRPTHINKVVNVELANGTPVRGATVFLAVKTNIWEPPSRTLTGKKVTGFATWHTANQANSSWPCGPNGNSFFDNSETNVSGLTDVDGRVVLKAFDSTGSDNQVTACYNDTEFSQTRTISFSPTGPTTIVLGYMARVNVSVSSLTVASGGSESVSAQVVDANGNPVSSQSVQVMAGSVDATATPLTCAGSQGTTNANGRVTLNICPSASGNYFLKSNGALSSRLIYVSVGSSSPAASSGGGGGGGGGGGDEDDAAPVVAAPKLTPTTTAAPRVIAAPKPASVPVMPAKAGVVVPNVVQPKAAVAQGLAIAASSNSLTVALKAPVSNSTATKITSYVVTMRSSTGAFLRRVVVPVKSSGQTVAPRFKVAKAGNYVIEISGRNSKGKSLGTYKSAPVKVGK